MNSTDVRLRDRSWSGAGVAPRPPIERLLPALAASSLLAIDVGLVLAAFLLAYWVRFIAPEDGAAALGLEQYARIGLTVGLGTAVLFALQGLYDADHPRAWPARLHLIVSSVSTAL